MLAMTSHLHIQVATGILCASYWRGSWYVLDHTLFPDDRLTSGIVSLAAGSGLLAMKQYILSPSYNGTKYLVRMLPPPTSVSLRTRYVQTNRFVVLYGIASACVLIWRGTWLLWDEGAHVVADGIAAWQRRREREQEQEGLNVSSTIQQLVRNQSDKYDEATAKMQQRLQQLQLPSSSAVVVATSSQHPIEHHTHPGESTVTDHDADVSENILFYSGIASHVVATLGLLCMGRFASVMAPPANVTMIRDVFIHGKGKDFARAARAFTHTG